jgi:ADP-ribose pyrophosphatase
MPEPTSARRAFAGRFLSVDLEEWPGIGAYEVVRHPGSAGVHPIAPSGDVLLVKQFRPPARQVLTEIPAGLLDVAGEDALSCAARELFQETGFRHETIEFLGGCYPSAGATDEYIHLFRARTASVPEREPEAGIELVREPLDRMVAAARSGRIRDAKTALALLLAADRPPLG